MTWSIEVLGWPVLLPPVIDQLTEFVGDQPGPGAGGVGSHPAREFGRDGAVAGQLTRRLIDPQQRRQRDHDLDLGVAALPLRQAVDRVPVQGGGADRHEGVGAELVSTAAVIGTGGGFELVGIGLHRGQHCLSVRAGQVGVDPRHRMLDRLVTDPPLGHRIGMLLLGPARVEFGDRAAQHGAKLRHRLGFGPFQRLGLHLRGDGGVEVLGYGHQRRRQQVPEPALLHRVQRVREFGDQPAGFVHPPDRVPGRPPQRTRHLVSRGQLRAAVQIDALPRRRRYRPGHWIGVPFDLCQMSCLAGVRVGDQPLVAFGHAQIGVHRHGTRIQHRRLGEPSLEPLGEPLIDFVHVFDSRNHL